MLNRLKHLIIICCLFGNSFTDVVIEIPNGKVKGYPRTTITNVTYYSYLGIPFAQPPVGELRFQAPQPALNWDGILDVKKNTKWCYQYATDSSEENEDCLYLNVFTPEKPGTNASLPVLVTFYGGAFKNGHAATLSPRAFIERDIIAVNLNYRVGIFGFLSTTDTVIPGNYGLKDQNLALNWVQKNIHIFGGDPKKVTINGHSAGSASVTFHYLSKKSKGLFRAGIAQSGSPLCNFAYAPTSRLTAYSLANSLNNSITEDNTSSEELIAFLRRIPARELDSAAAKLKEWAPVVEPEHDGAFITEPMYEAVEQGHINKLPLLIGINSEEALIQKGEDLEALKKSMIRYDANVSKLVNVDMHIVDKNNLTGIGTAIRYMYTQKLFQDDLGAAIRYFSDNQYTRAIIKYAKLHAQYADVYFYLFSYHGTLGNNNITVEGAERVAHGEELKYVWISDKLNYNDYPKSDGITCERFGSFFAEFTKSLNPTLQKQEITQNIIWPKVNATHFSYLDLNENLTIKLNPKEFTFLNWELMYDYYAIRPFTTY